MKTMTVGEFKTHFSEVVEQVKAGVSFAVTYGRKKEVVGYFLPESQLEKQRRQLGLFKGKLSVDFKNDFQITEENLLG
jgi:hypothetical protein